MQEKDGKIEFDSIFENRSGHWLDYVVSIAVVAGLVRTFLQFGVAFIIE